MFRSFPQTGHIRGRLGGSSGRSCSMRAISCPQASSQVGAGSGIGSAAGASQPSPGRAERPVKVGVDEPHPGEAAMSIDEGASEENSRSAQAVQKAWSSPTPSLQ